MTHPIPEESAALHAADGKLVNNCSNGILTPTDELPLGLVRSKVPKDCLPHPQRNLCLRARHLHLAQTFHEINVSANATEGNVH